MTLREAIYAEALTWLATPYHDLAHVKQLGCDCGGLIIGVAKALGALDPAWRCPPYAPSRHFHQRDDLMSGLLEACGCTPVAWDARQPGDVITFRFGLVTSHAAFLLPDNALVHAVQGQGVIRTPLAGTWLALHDRAWAFPGVEDTACR